MKRIISILLIFVILIGCTSNVFAEESSLSDKIVSKLMQYTPEDRKNIYSLVLPQFITNSGVDFIASLIETNDPSLNNDIDQLIGKVLEYVDKETAIKSINVLKLFDEEIREKYATIFLKKQTINVSFETKESLDLLLNSLYKKNANLKTLLTEDGVTPELIANLLKFLVDINDGQPLFTDNYSDKRLFSINQISSKLSNSTNQALSDLNLDIDISASLLDMLNTKFTTAELKAIKQVGKEIGFYKPVGSSLSVGDSGKVSGGATNTPLPDSSTIQYRIVKESTELDMSAADYFIEIYSMKDGVKQPHGTLDNYVILQVPINVENVLAFNYNNLKSPFKYCVSDSQNLYIKTNQTGYYAINEMPNYFADVNGWGKQYIEKLYYRGIVNGKSKGYFFPEDNITREEFVKLIVELFNLTDNNTTIDFIDVNKDEWYYKYIAAAYQNKIINGKDNLHFGIGENITRQDMCKIITNVLVNQKINVNPTRDLIAFKDNSLIDSYAIDSINQLYSLNIISGDLEGNFRPKNYATRQEAAKIIYGILSLYVLNN